MKNYRYCVQGQLNITEDLIFVNHKYDIKIDTCWTTTFAFLRNVIKYPHNTKIQKIYNKARNAGTFGNRKIDIKIYFTLPIPYEQCKRPNDEPRQYSAISEYTFKDFTIDRIETVNV